MVLKCCISKHDNVPILKVLFDFNRDLQNQNCFLIRFIRPPLPISTRDSYLDFYPTTFLPVVASTRLYPAFLLLPGNMNRCASATIHMCELAHPDPYPSIPPVVTSATTLNCTIRFEFFAMMLKCSIPSNSSVTTLNYTMISRSPTTTLNYTIC